MEKTNNEVIIVLKERAINALQKDVDSLLSNSICLSASYSKYRTLPIHQINNIRKDCENILSQLNILSR